MCHGSPWKTLPWGQGRRQWFEFLGRDKEAPKEGMVLVKRLSRAPKGCCAHSVTGLQTQDSRPGSCRRHHQLWLFCAILAPGGCGLLLPRERGSLFVSASLGESFPSGRMGLNSALGYVLASPAVDDALPSAFSTRARAWGFLALSESFMAKSIGIKWRKKMNWEGRKHFGSTSSSAEM